MGKEFLNDLNIHGAGQIQFKTTAGANAGKIDQDGNDLVLSNAVGDIIIGNGSDDVFIGDGTNAVDIRFEQNMAIFADSSSTRTLTLGGANTNLILESPTINGSISLGATTINNKLTLTSSNGYIVFDYEPSTGSNAEYTNEVPLLKVDKEGTEKTILSRLSNNGALALGIDDTVAIVAGDTKAVIEDNHNYPNENIVLASEGGFTAYGFPDNSTQWSNRNVFQFRSDSSTAGDNGLYIGDGGQTQFIDLSRNLKNIASIRGSGNMPFLTDGGSALKIRARSAYFGGTYANDGANDGEVDAESGFRVGGTSVIDSSRNLANIGTITASGKISGGEIEGTSLDINGAADIAGKLVINTNSDDILTLNQNSGTGTKWNYINFNQNATREWFIGQDTDGNFDIYNDVIDQYAITINRSNNSILLNDTVSIAQALTVVSGDINLSAGNIVVGSQYGIRFNDANTRIYTNTDTPEDLLIEADQDILLTPDGQVNVHSNLVLSDNSYVVSARKFTARDGNGVMLTADDAASGLSIADNGNATFTSTVTAATTFIADAVDATNSDPGTDNVRYSGYGMIGNRGNLYVTNFNSSGTVQIGVGGAHNAAPKLSVGTVNTTFNTGIRFGADSTYDIGTNATRAANIYADTLHGDGSNITNVSATDSTKLPLAGGTMTGDIDMNDEMLTYHNGNPELPQFRGKRSNTDLDDRDWDTEGGWSYTTFENNTTNKPSTGLHNGNGLLSFNTHGGDGTNNYMHQIAMTTQTDKLWHRRRNGTSWGNWEEIKKGDITFASLTSKPTTLAGYGITDAQASGNYITGTGSLSAQDLTDIGNLSGTNTGDQVLPTDFVSAANGGTFSGDIQAPGIYVGSTNTNFDFYNNGTSYLNGAVTIDDNLTVTGNLTITGDINTQTVNNLDVVDKLITLGKGQTEANSNGSGIFVDGSSASLLWDESNNTWDFNKSLDVVGNINASGKVTIPQTSTTIGGSNLGNASLLLGSTTSGIGIDTNEIVSKGDHLYIGTVTDGKNIIFRTDGTSAVLTLDSSQNATFAGQVTSGRLNITDAAVSIMLTESGNTGTGKYWRQVLDAGDIRFDVDTTSTNGDGSFSSYNALIQLNADGHTDINGALDVAGNIDANGNLDVAGNIVVAGTVDGRDIAADGTKLDGIAAGATANTGTVTSVSATAPLTSTGGTTPTIAADTAAVSSGSSKLATGVQIQTAIDNAVASYLPLAGGTMTGDLIVSHTDSSDAFILKLTQGNNGSGVGIQFNDNPAGAQKGYILHRHSDSESYGGGASFQFRSTEDDLVLSVGNADSTHGRVVVWSGGSASEVDYGFAQDIDTGMRRTSANNVSLMAGGIAGVGVSATASSMKYAGSTKFATTNTGVSITGNIAVTGTVDGRDIATDGTKLDTIATNATANAGTVTNVTVGTGLDVSNGTTTPNITLDLTEISLSPGLDSTPTSLSLDLSEVQLGTGLDSTSQGLSLDLSEFANFDSSQNSVEKILAIDDESETTKVNPGQFTYQTLTAHFSQSTGSSSTFNIPMNNTTESTTATYYHVWTPPFDGKVKTMIMKHAHGVAPSLVSASPTKFRVAVNGTGADYTSSSFLTRVRVEGRNDDYYAYIKDDNINQSFSAGDRVYFQFLNSSSSVKWNNCSVSIVVEYNIT